MKYISDNVRSENIINIVFVYYKYVKAYMKKHKLRGKKKELLK